MAKRTAKKRTKNDNEATDEKRFKFLCLLSECGNVSDAARRAKLNRQFLYDFRDSNTDFAAAWEKCVKIAGEALKDEARRRAVQGVLEPVYYKGKRCGYVRKYSDSLLALLLRATFPEEFAERHKSEMTGKGGGPMEIICSWEDESPDNADGQG